MISTNDNEEQVWDPISRELRFQEVVFNDFQLDEENPYFNDVQFLERLYDHYNQNKEKSICKKLKRRIISVKKYNNAFGGYLY